MTQAIENPRLVVGGNVAGFSKDPETLLVPNHEAVIF